MTQLYYIMDPMCAWCYAFGQEIKSLMSQLKQHIPLQYVMGGLAPDSNEPMTEQMKLYIQQAWESIEQRTDVRFNFDFWLKAKPIRSTYPACRAVIAAGLQNKEKIPLMVEAIQKGYYQQARNPSLVETLIEFAGEISLSKSRFIEDFNSKAVEQQLEKDFLFRDQLGVRGFPTLILHHENQNYGLTQVWTTAKVLMELINPLLKKLEKDC